MSEINCYKCRTSKLAPKKLDFGLPALQCGNCEGTYLDLLTYRGWLEDFGDEIKTEQQTRDMSDNEVDITSVENTEHALVCQRCQKFMLKYRINNEQENTINVCHTCDDVWLDSGEWELLKQLNIQDKLTQIMSQPWQNNLANQNKESAFQAHFQSLLGDDYEKVADFAEWLNSHPQKGDIKHYLMA